MVSIYKKLADLSEQNITCALVIITHTSGSTPRKTGSKMIVLPDGKIYGTIGGGNLEIMMITKALEIIHQETPLLINRDLHDDADMECGGAVTVYIEPIPARKRLFIFGAGHIGQKLAPLGKKLGFQVHIIDERPELTREELFPEHTILHQNQPLDFINNWNFIKDDYIVIMTHQHQHDQDILEQVVMNDVTYIGMIGSQRKVAKTFENLRNHGIEQERLDKVYAPIGLKIRAETPSEIAILIAAELIQVLHG